jgi:hypothetical protein
MDCTADTCTQQLPHTRHNSQDNGQVRRNLCKIELLDQIDGTRRVSEVLTRCVSACTNVDLAIRSLLFYLVWHFLTTSNLKIANKSGVFHLQLASSHLKQSLRHFWNRLLRYKNQFFTDRAIFFKNIVLTCSRLSTLQTNWSWFQMSGFLN